MKNKTRFAFGIVLVLCMLLSSFGAVAAAPLQADPVVTIISGGETLTITKVPFGKLPGTFVGDKGGITPLGFTSGEKQFSGAGVKLTGLQLGIAQICFSFPGKYGWSGDVYKWNGDSWIKQDSSITPGIEGAQSKACALAYADGTYALIMGYRPPAGPNEIKECTDIDFIIPDFTFYTGDDGKGWVIPGGYTVPSLPMGTIVTYQLINIDPNELWGSLKATGSVVFNGVDGDITYSHVIFPENTIVKFPSDSRWGDYTFTIRFFTQGCYKDFRYPDDIPMY